ncbi:NUDIX domain-containing protein [Pseudomonas sp. Fl5BN2]|nr:NUDIX domain-containing protein [Pseudomonas sp. Fl5BN2]
MPRLNRANGLHPMTESRIRALALCVFHHNGKILVNQFHDPDQQQMLFRPLGGGIDFGEHSAQAIVREVQEELGLSINHLSLIGTLESLFVYDGKPGHEIVQVYDARFEDPSVYQRTHLDAQESDGARFIACWHDSSRFTAQTPLVPAGLGEMLKQAGLLD